MYNLFLRESVEVILVVYFDDIVVIFLIQNVTHACKYVLISFFSYLYVGTYLFCEIVKSHGTLGAMIVLFYFSGFITFASSTVQLNAVKFQ